MAATRENSDNLEGFEKYYDEVLRPSESEEFRQWFEHWYGKEKDYVEAGIADEYLSERRFALIGWHAALMPDKRMDLPGFFAEINKDRALKRCIKEKNDYCRGSVYNWRPAAEFVIDEGIKRVQKNWAKRWKI